MTTTEGGSGALLTARAEEARLFSAEEVQFPLKETSQLLTKKAQLPLTKTPELFFTEMPQLSTEDAHLSSSPSLFSTASPLPSFWSTALPQGTALQICSLLLTFYSDFYMFPCSPSLPMFILFGGAE
jgi:hypothetical protein